jgi:carbamoylphosphate synthase small subunit
MDLATGRVYITSHNHGFAAALPGRANDVVVATTSSGARRCGNDVVEPGPEAARDGTDWSHVPQQTQQPFDTPYGTAVVSHVNLNDGVVEGLRLEQRPVFSVQYHPEAAPGPHDAADHFDQFCALLDHQTGR